MAGRKLLSDFLSHALYSQGSGYFVGLDVVKRLSKPLEFTQFRSKNDYIRTLADIYMEHDQSWLTPVEIFRPYYARAIARQLLSESGSNGMNIFEVGGGKGTLAEGILSFLRDEHPNIYAKTHYTIVEISKPLAEKQEKILRPFRDHYTIVNDSFLNGNVRASSSGPNWVVALEVFDNLPHDRVVIRNNAAYETHVVIPNDGTQVSEELVPLENADILSAMKMFGMSSALPMGSDGQQQQQNGARRLSKWLASMQSDVVLWVPTSAYRFLVNMKENFKKSGLLVADYSVLLDTLNGVNAPAIQSRDMGRTVNHRHYLSHVVTEGKADVLFPTNFESLAKAAFLLLGERGRIRTHEEFMKVFVSSDLAATTTKSGYNPLIEDFTNQCVFTLAPKEIK